MNFLSCRNVVNGQCTGTMRRKHARASSTGDRLNFERCRTVSEAFTSYTTTILPLRISSTMIHRYRNYCEHSCSLASLISYTVNTHAYTLSLYTDAVPCAKYKIQYWRGIFLNNRKIRGTSERHVSKSTKKKGSRNNTCENLWYFELFLANSYIRIHGVQLPQSYTQIKTPRRVLERCQVQKVYIEIICPDVSKSRFHVWN